MIDRVRESRNPKKVIRVTLMESYGEIGRVPVNLSILNTYGTMQSPYIGRFFGIIFSCQSCLVRWSQREIPTNQKESINQ